jgi:hypothetical protein
MTMSESSRSIVSAGVSRGISLLALGIVTAGVGLLCGPTALSGQHPEADRPIRIVIPEGMPAFDPDVGDRYFGAVPPRAIVFPHEPGAEDMSLIMVNPRHVEVQTLAAALSLLMRSLDAGRGELIAVSDRMARNEGLRIDRRLVAGELVRLNSAPRSEIPRVGYGRMIMTERFTVEEGKGLQ